MAILKYLKFMICAQCKKFTTKKVAELALHLKTGCKNEIWAQIAEARRNGQDSTVDRLIRKAFGIHRPMSEEAKEKLRLHNEEHKEDIKLKRKFQRKSQQRIKEKLNGG